MRPIARDLANAGSLPVAIDFLVLPPGWRPDGSSLTTRDARRAAPQVS
ncbi:hypothetical protein [Burkholderia anthina]|nr:hypothetical protein [Burkholderia anthina]